MLMFFLVLLEGVLCCVLFITEVLYHITSLGIDQLIVCVVMSDAGWLRELCRLCSMVSLKWKLTVYSLTSVMTSTAHQAVVIRAVTWHMMTISLTPALRLLVMMWIYHILPTQIRYLASL